MRLALLLITLLGSLLLRSQYSEPNFKAYPIPFDELESEKGEVNYELNEIIKLIEDSIHLKKKVIIPKGVNQFERILFTARRAQHNDSQLVAINLFQNVLEFQYYRSRGEELYLKLLLAKSLQYIGANQMANQRMGGVFPELLNYLHSDFIKAFFLGHYADLLKKVEDYETAIEVYRDRLKYSQLSMDSALIYDCQNQLGFAFLKLGKLDSASHYLSASQDPLYQHINPVLYAFSFGNYAPIHLAREQFHSALISCRIEERLLAEIPSTNGLHKLYQTMAEVYENLNMYDSAIYFTKRSIYFGEKTKDLEFLADNYQNLVRYYLKQNNEQGLIDALGNYQLMSDSLLNFYKNDFKLEELKTSEFFRIYSQAQRSREDFEQLSRSNQSLYMVIISLGVLIGILILLMFYRYYSRKQLALINEDLTTKNKDLARYNEIITETNQKNELLLKELHHRVKNNLQIVSSLFRLQMNSKKLSEESMAIFKIAQERIHSISLLHKKIYQSEVISNLDFKSYLEELSQEIIESNPENLAIELDIPSVQMSIDTALPLGLIFNELFTNSIKHAKVADELKIQLTYSNQNGKESFVYQDNGSQATKEIFKDLKEDSLGRELIELLSMQIDADLSYENNESQAGFYLKITGCFSEVKQAPIQNHDL
jgi:two-component sensor histidine kinase